MAVPTVLSILERFNPEGCTVIFSADYSLPLEAFREILRRGEGDNHAAIIMPGGTEGYTSRTWFLYEWNDTGILMGREPITLHYDRHTDPEDRRPRDDMEAEALGLHPDHPEVQFARHLRETQPVDRPQYEVCELLPTQGLRPTGMTFDSALDAEKCARRMSCKGGRGVFCYTTKWRG